MSKLEAHIALNKGRLKEYHGNTVYLKDESNFQVELFNGEQDTFGVILELNGSPISTSKLVLKPGERVFLDRYIDDQVKFLFETYEVDGDDEQVQEAIKNNGNVFVKFYKEKQVTINQQIDPVDWSFSSTGTFPLNISAPGITGSMEVSGSASIMYSNATVGMGTSTPSSTLNVSSTGTSLLLDNSNITDAGSTAHGSLTIDSTSGDAVNFTTTDAYNADNVVMTTTTTDSFDLNEDYYMPVRDLNKVETGRIAKGESSDQRLDSVDVHFDLLHSYEINLNIKPESTRESYSNSDVRSYCTNCGTRAKRNWKFCATCGRQI